LIVAFIMQLSLVAIIGLGTCTFGGSTPSQTTTEQALTNPEAQGEGEGTPARLLRNETAQRGGRIALPSGSTPPRIG
jgi:hypothetical protein